jgi:prepilin-type N-terminal cleavage/methylation domain-containing protein
MKSFIQNNSGFTFIEVMTAFMIISIAAVGMMMGASHAQGELRSLGLKERATEELLNYTEYWRGRIADGRLSQSEVVGNLEGEQVYLRGSATSQDKVVAKVYYDITQLDDDTEFGKSSFSRLKLETWIKWSDFLPKGNVQSRPQRKRRLETVMAVFN